MGDSLHPRVGGLDADSTEVADLTRQGSDGVVGGVQSDADDADAPLTVGDAHAADDVLSVLVEQGIDGLHRIRGFHDDAHDGDSGLHDKPPTKIKNAPYLKGHGAQRRTDKPTSGVGENLPFRPFQAGVSLTVRYKDIIHRKGRFVKGFWEIIRKWYYIKEQ